MGARSSLVPQFITDDLRFAQGWVYGAFLIVSLVSGALLLPFGRTADTLGRRPVIIFGLLIGAVGFVALPTLHGAAGLVLAMALIGVAGAADSVAPGAVMGDVVGGRGGTVVAVFQMAGDLGAILGPVVAGAVADAAGFTPAFLVSAAVCVVPIVLVVSRARDPEGRHRPGPTRGRSRLGRRRARRTHRRIAVNRPIRRPAAGNANVYVAGGNTGSARQYEVTPI